MSSWRFPELGLHGPCRQILRRSSGVQIPRDMWHMCTRFGRCLYCTKCSWIMKDQTTFIDCACFIALTLLERQAGCERISVILVPDLALAESAKKATTRHKKILWSFIHILNGCEGSVFWLINRAVFYDVTRLHIILFCEISGVLPWHNFHGLHPAKDGFTILVETQIVQSWQIQTCNTIANKGLQ